MQNSDKLLKTKLKSLLPKMNEKQRRLLVGAEAKALGRGGILKLSKLTGMSRDTIYKGISELGDKKKDDKRIRIVGGGRKKILEIKPKLKLEIEKIIDGSVRGDPESLLRWTCKSVRNIESELLRKGYKVSYRTIATILHQEEYNLQGNKKNLSGKDSHPDRNAQFKYINSQGKSYVKQGLPVISVDTKKKELVGNYKNNGKEWHKKGTSTEVLDHDFPDPKVSKAVPYGIYDISKNTGWVNVGIDGDTAEFAVESIRKWWNGTGKKQYKKAKKLLIFADAGGSNSYRTRLWKTELQKFAKEAKIEITVIHFPPGTSKWNKIEHRLFSFITMNWRGKPLRSYSSIINLISATKTKTGLTVEARLDKNKYKTGIKISKQEMKDVNLIKHKFHGEWNYTISFKKKKKTDMSVIGCSQKV
jgi:hypothetical protein